MRRARRVWITVVVATAAVAALPSAAPARGVSSADLSDLSPHARQVYAGVEHNAKTPRIGPIVLAHSGGRLVARFTVRYPDIVAKGVRARSSGTVQLRVWRRIGSNLQPRGELQSEARRRRLPRGGGTVRFAIPLSAKATAWLKGHGRKKRRDLVRVEADLRVDVDRDGRIDHDRNAAATMGYSRAAPKATASSAENTITLELLNLTPAPIHNIAMPVMCMYDQGKEGSNVSGFNYLPEGNLRSGGSHVGTVAADGSFFRSPEVMYEEDEISELVEVMEVALEVTEIIFKDMPAVSSFIRFAEIGDDCENNVSLFGFVASEANECPQKERECNLSTSGAWVMSEREVGGGNFEPTIDSAVAAANYQATEFQGAIPPWGFSPFEEPLDYSNPSSQALYPLAYPWLTYVDAELPCVTKLGAMEWTSKPMIGDHGLSWNLGHAGGPAWILEVLKTGLERGWSGANPGNRVWTGNTADPTWIEQHPRSNCSGW